MSEVSPTLRSTIEIEIPRTCIYIDIGECGSTLCVGLPGIVWMLIQSLQGWTRPIKAFLILFLIS